MQIDLKEVGYAVGIVMVGIIFIVLINLAWQMLVYEKTAPCEYYANRNYRNLPARCINYYQQQQL